MGVSLMTGKKDYSQEEKAKLRSKILKRSWFLFFAGLLLYNWWSGDILHFYGGYLHFAAFLIFVPKRYYLWTAVATIIIFHLLLCVIPVTTSWDFTTFKYTDFWTPGGFLRNSFYNGWNSIFPWLSYFLIGMWLGRLNWKAPGTKRSIFLTGLAVFLIIQGLRFLVRAGYFSPFWSDYIMSEYFPAYLPFIMITASFAFMVIPVCMYFGERYPGNKVVLSLAKTGQMTLSHYVIHLPIGMVIMAQLTGKQYTGLLEDETPTLPIIILGYATLFYIASIFLSVLWTNRFKHGPLEMLMRKISG